MKLFQCLLLLSMISFCFTKKLLAVPLCSQLSTVSEYNFRISEKDNLESLFSQPGFQKALMESSSIELRKILEAKELNEEKSSREFTKLSNFINAVSQTSLSNVFKHSKNSMVFPSHKLLVSNLESVQRASISKKLPISEMKWPTSKTELSPKEQIEYFSKNAEFVLKDDAGSFVFNLQNSYFNFIVGRSLTKRLQRLGELWLEVRAEMEKDYLKAPELSWITKKPNGPNGVEKIVLTREDIRSIDILVMNAIQMILSKTTKQLLTSKLDVDILSRELGEYTNLGLNNFLVSLIGYGSNQSKFARQYAFNYFKNAQVENWRFGTKAFESIVEESNRNLEFLRSAQLR